MTDIASPSENASASRPLASVAEGRALLESFQSTMEELLGLVESETALVQKGWLAEAAKLNERKSELAGRYLAATLRLRASAAFLNRHLAEGVHTLKTRHSAFRALLQVNLTVLATAHAIAESIIRTAAGELSRQATPRGYGAGGRAVEPGPKSAQPLALSRTA